MSVVVTGASAGVGRATALAFARQGEKVGLLARDSAALEEVRAEIEAQGGKAICLPADVADAEAVTAAADTCSEALGPIEVWVNNAMVTVYSPVEELAAEEIRRVTEVTYLGTVHGTLTALRHMRPRNHGVVVQVGSSLAYRGIPLQAAYCGAKHAIRGFTDSLRAELTQSKSAIAVTAVHLPAINTPQFDWARSKLAKAPRPVAPVYTPETAADAIVHAARHPVREYWLAGTTPLTILANTVFPGVMDLIVGSQAMKGQKSEQDAAPDRQDNLFAPVSGLHRTEGRFGAEAKPQALCFPAPATRVGGLAAVCLAAGLFGFMVATIMKPSRDRLPSRG